MRPRALLLLLLVGHCFLATRAAGFSVIGPFADWMTPALGYWPQYELGGPMNIDEEYRWNVPVLTYSFDRSFIDFFGSNGVAAVESAVELLNGLPPASEITLTNYPAYAFRQNWAATFSHLIDLKTEAVVALLRAMGLGCPSESAFVFRAYDPVFREWPWEAYWPTGTIPNLILERNFDPATLSPSHWVNDTRYTAYVFELCEGSGSISAERIDPDAVSWPAAADFDQWSIDQAGLFIRSLTRDDAGGLRYLLSSNNVNLEILLPGVTGCGTNEGRYVDAAMRPGVEKVILIRQDYDSLLGQFFRPFTNYFVDTYWSNGLAFQQTLMRVVSAPDILFSAEDLEVPYRATALTQWWNSGQLIGAAVLGPGVVRPPIKISFHKRAGFMGWSSVGPMGGQEYWGSFADGAEVTRYPVTAGQETPFMIRFTLRTACPNFGQVLSSHSWQLPATNGAAFSLEGSTNLTDWVPYMTVTNQGGIFSWEDLATEGRRFYRVVPR